MVLTCMIAAAAIALDVLPPHLRGGSIGASLAPSAVLAPSAAAQFLEMPLDHLHLQPEDMATMKECFLTGTAAEVTPVARIGDYSFTPSDACRQLVTAYDDLVNGRISL